MRIDVRAEGTIGQQARTYAEYRVFAALTQLLEAQKVRRVRVRLRPVKLGRRCACTVTVGLEGLDNFRVRATARHVYAAINRAVERMEATAMPGIANRVSVRDISL